MLQLSDFENQTRKNWESQATNDLKGENPFETLTWLSEENIEWKPIYTIEDSQIIPTKEISLTQKRASGLNRHLVETIYLTDNQPETIRVANQKALELRTKGVTAFIFDLATISFSATQLQKLIQGIKTAETPVYWKTSEPSSIYSNQKTFSPHLLKGGILQPLSYHTEDNKWETNNERISLLLIQTKQEPTFKVIHASTLPFANAGGNAVQELAYFCNQWVEMLSKLSSEGHDLQEIIGKTLFETTVTTNYFLDIAKIRSLRYLLHKIHTSFDTRTSDISPYIIGGLASYYISPFSAHTNMLRATTATMSGLTGGLDAVYIPTWDSANTDVNSSAELAQRVAVNTFHVIQEEALLTASNDPSEGSYFIESLTFELIQQAWSLFLSNESKGGFETIYKNGEIDTALLQTHENRINQKSKVMVGVNKYTESVLNQDALHTQAKTFLATRSLPNALREKSV